MITAQVEKITPAVAKAYLEMNKNNRNIRQRVVDAYARDMAAGEWVVQHQGIAFDVDGNLVDGQHRLQAVIKAGVAVPMMVTRGLEKNSSAGIDQGAKRSFTDVLTMQHPETTVYLKNTRLVSAIRNTIYYNVGSINLTFNEVCFVFDCFQYVYKAIYPLANKRSARSTGVVLAACASALIYGENPEIIEKWFDCFSDSDIRDSGDFNVAAALNWRRQLDDAVIKGSPMSRTNLFLGTENSIWNFCNNTEIRTVKVPKTARYDIRNELIRAIQTK